MKTPPDVRRPRRGIDRFRAALNAGVLEEIEPWRQHPELRKLIKRWESLADPRQFLDTYAEIMVARRLLRNACTLRVEVPTRKNKRADFEVTRGAVVLYVHVKKLNLDDCTRRLYRIADCSKVLEPIDRDDVEFDVSVLGTETTEDEIRTFPRRLKKFARSAASGATLLLPDESHPVLRVEILPRGRAARPKQNPSFPRYPGPWMRDPERFKRKLAEAAAQFMPDRPNLIAVTSHWAADETDFEKTLLDFWSRTQHPAPVMGAFFRFAPEDDDFTSSLYLREARGVDQETSQLVRDVFDDQPATSQAPVAE